jgi:transcriptional regulator with XRE-family HTH domain
MSEQTVTLCDLWSGEQVEAKFHSRLCHLEPIGVGSPMVESLTSYIMRLAETHSVQPSTLIRKEIYPLLNRTYLYQDGRLGRTFAIDSARLNGIAKTNTGLLVQVLEQLTLRSDLHFLTMLTFAEVLSQRNLVRRTRAWCPVCYDEWRKAGHVIYDPLLWALESVSRCPRHGKPLSLKCPNPACARTQYPLALRGQPGYCMSCDQWLGNASQSEAESPADAEEQWAWQHWVANAVGELLSATPGFSTQPSREALASMITVYVNARAEGNFHMFARQLHVAFSAVWQWQHGQQAPQLGTLVQICAQLGTSPLCFLTGNTGKASSLQRHTPPGELLPPDKSKRQQRRTDIKKLQTVLEAVLQENPPPSLAEVGRRLGGYDPSDLAKHFSDLCRAISARYREYKHNRGVERRQSLREQVRLTAQTVYSQGLYPSKHRIEALLNMPGILRRYEINAAWHDSLRELGLR